MGPNVPAINGKAVDVNHHKLVGINMSLRNEAIIHTSVGITLELPVLLHTPLWIHCFPSSFGGVVFEVEIAHHNLSGVDVFPGQDQSWYRKNMIFRRCRPWYERRCSNC
jgi:hypothetical protein